MCRRGSPKVPVDFSDGSTLTVDGALCHSESALNLDWKCILHGSLCAVDYIHSRAILHNNIKGNNIVIEKLSQHICQPVLIDFGKACYTEGRTYKLS